MTIVQAAWTLSTCIISVEQPVELHRTARRVRAWSLVVATTNGLPAAAQNRRLSLVTPAHLDGREILEALRQPRVCTVEDFRLEPDTVRAHAKSPLKTSVENVR